MLRLAFKELPNQAPSCVALFPRSLTDKIKGQEKVSGSRLVLFLYFFTLTLQLKLTKDQILNVSF